MAETRSVAITIDKTTLTLVALVLLLVVVAFQWLQVNELKNRVALGATVASVSGSTAASTSAAPAASSASAPSSLNDLPSMVGGC